MLGYNETVRMRGRASRVRVRFFRSMGTCLGNFSAAPASGGLVLGLASLDETHGIGGAADVLGRPYLKYSLFDEEQGELK